MCGLAKTLPGNTQEVELAGGEGSNHHYLFTLPLYTTYIEQNLLADPLLVSLLPPSSRHRFLQRFLWLLSHSLSHTHTPIGEPDYQSDQFSEDEGEGEGGQEEKNGEKNPLQFLWRSLLRLPTTSLSSPAKVAERLSDLSVVFLMLRTKLLSSTSCLPIFMRIFLHPLCPIEMRVSLQKQLSACLNSQQFTVPFLAVYKVLLAMDPSLKWYKLLTPAYRLYIFVSTG